MLQNTSTMGQAACASDGTLPCVTAVAPSIPALDDIDARSYHGSRRRDTLVRRQCVEPAGRTACVLHLRYNLIDEVRVSLRRQLHWA
jgi:hypothetical protein